MITGVDFAVLNSFSAQASANWAKQISQLQLLTSREMYFFDSFMIENLNCFELYVDGATRHEWSGLGEPPDELKALAKENKKPYSNMIRYIKTDK